VLPEETFGLAAQFRASRTRAPVGRGGFGLRLRSRYIRAMFGLPQSYDRPRNVRLDTLVRLRWLAVFGQLAALLVVHFGLDYVVVPIWSCIAVIAVAALLNVALRVGFPQTQWLEPDRAAWLLVFDIAELAALLYLTGGLENPFSFLLLGPVLISATALPPRMTLLIGTFAMLCATVLVFFHYDLPWETPHGLELPEIYGGRLVIDPARDRLYRRLYVAGGRGSAAI